MSRRALALALGALVLSAVGRAAAAPSLAPDPPPDQVELEPEDYDVGNPAWNGLSSFAQLAAGAGLEVQAMRRIDWGRIRTSDLLVILYPVRELDASALNRFVQAGGTLIVGDDFGGSTRFLGRLHMLRDDGYAPRAGGYWDDLPFAPIARPRDPNHPLARGVAELVTNHPAVLTEVGGAQIVFELGPGEAVLVAGQFGEGRFAVLSDPSVLINGMLAFPGNFELALNLLRYFAPGEGGRVVLLSSDFSLTGQPAGLDDDLRGSMAGRMRELNGWLDELNDWVLDHGAMRVLGAMGALAAALLVTVILPSKKVAPLDGAWLRARDPAYDLPSTRDLEALLARFDAPGYRGSYARAAAALRDATSARLARQLGEPAPLSMPSGELLARVEARCGPEARIALAAAAPMLARFGPGAAQGGAVSRGELMRLADQLERLEHALGRERA